MCGLDELEELVRVLADEGLGVVAGDVVPLDAVVVDVVEHTHAGLHAPVNVELGVVGLGHVLGLLKKVVCNFLIKKCISLLL